MTVLLVVAILLGGCHGAMIDAMQERQIASCWWWRGPLGGHGVTATGGIDIRTCLQVPCQLHP